MRILIVEDYKDTADSLQKLFEAEGHTVDIADNGVHGLFLLLTNEYDGAIVDIRLPEMNGWEFVRRMDLSQHRVPIIMSTGFTVEPPEGMERIPVLLKPYDFDILLALCESNFGKVTA